MVTKAITDTKNTAMKAGVVAGIIAGIAMAMVAMIVSWSSGLGLWLPVKNIAVTFLGVDALIGEIIPILTGLTIHLVVSSIYGLIFGLIALNLQKTLAVFAVGLLYGSLIWLAMTFAALPLFNPIMLERISLTFGWWFFYHLVFGATLTTVVPLRRAFGKTSVLPPSETDYEVREAA